MTKKKQEVGKVPNLRFPEFDGEWEEKRLGDTATFINGRAYQQKELLDRGKYRVLRVGNFFSNNSWYYSDLELDENKYCDQGDLLYAWSASFGPKIWDGEKCIYHYHIWRVLPHKCILSKYLFYTLDEQTQKIKTNSSNGFALIHITKGTIESWNILVPSLPEQTQIASFLSLIDERIQCQNKIIHQLETLIQNLREKIFKQQIRFKDENGEDFPDWEVKKLGEIAKIFDGTHQTPNYVDNGIPFFSVENVTANNFTNTKYISKEVFERENKRVKIELGDILMTRIGDIGTVRYIDWEAEASFYVSLALIKQSEFYNSEYLAHYFATDKFQSELWNRTIHVAFPKKINLGEIGECLVSVPCDLEQTYIANFLTVFASKIETEKKILQLYKNQKAYLLKNMFI